MSSEDEKIEETCNTVHSILQAATKDIPIPDPQKARDARKKISVFTYGIIIELTANKAINEDTVYFKYLMMGGLNSNQANMIVKRTRDEFTKREFGADCLKAANNAVNQWVSGNKNIQSLVEVLL